MKLSTFGNKISTCHHENKSQLLAKTTFHKILKTFDLMFKLSTTKVLRFVLWEGF